MHSSAIYKVAHKEFETHNVVRLILKPASETEKINDFKAGQFVILHLLDEEGKESYKNPYSISCAPNSEGEICLGIKICGAFTSASSKLEKGDGVHLSGPFGAFIFDPEKHKSAVIFSGGIGITPFLSMALFAAQENLSNKIHLFYANRSESDIAYYLELKELAKENPNFSISFVVDEGPVEKDDITVGSINWDLVKSAVDVNENTYYFLCGPKGFMDYVIDFLNKNGVDKEHIKKEIF